MAVFGVKRKVMVAGAASAVLSVHDDMQDLTLMATVGTPAIERTMASGPEIDAGTATWKPVTPDADGVVLAAGSTFTAYRASGAGTVVACWKG